MVAHIFNSSICEAEAGRPEFKDSKFQGNHGYPKTCLEKKKKIYIVEAIDEAVSK